MRVREGLPMERGSVNGYASITMQRVENNVYAK